MKLLINYECKIINTILCEELIKTPPEKSQIKLRNLYVLYIEHKDFENKITIYIGKSKNIKARFSAHRYQIKSYLIYIIKMSIILNLISILILANNRVGTHIQNSFFIY